MPAWPVRNNNERQLSEALSHPKSVGLPVTFETIGLGERGAEYVGLMPGPAPSPERQGGAREAESISSEIERQVRSILHQDFWDRTEDMRRAVERGSGVRSLDEWGARVFSALAEPSRFDA